MRISELKVLALLRYRENYHKYAGLLKEDFFSIAETKELFRFIGTYHAKYAQEDKVPLAYLRIQAEDVPDEGRRNLIEEIVDQLQIKNRSDEFVEDLIRKFGQRAILKQAVLDAFDMLQGKEDTLDLDKIKGKIESAMEVVIPKVERTSFFEEIDEQITAVDTEPRIPTGIRELDEHTRGGLPKGRLGLVVAPPKRGKTAFLINIGAGAIRMGFKVIHFTLEINKRETAVRYASSFLNRPFEFLRQYPEQVKKALTKLKARGGELYIEESIGVAPTVEEIESVIRSHRTKFDMAIIDYPDLCATRTSFKEERAHYKEIYTGLRRLGTKMDLTMWGASQSNRGSFAKKIISMEDIAEDIRKIAICDLAVFVCQTPEEKEEALARLFVGATRFGSKNPVFTVACDFDCMKIASIRREPRDGSRV